MTTRCHEARAKLRKEGMPPDVIDLSVDTDSDCDSNVSDSTELGMDEDAEMLVTTELEVSPRPTVVEWEF